MKKLYKNIYNNSVIVIFVFCAVFLFNGALKAQDSDNLLSNEDVSKINISSNIEPEKLQQEIVELNIELDQLNKRLNEEAVKNIELQSQLSAFKEAAQKNNTIHLKTKELQDLIVRLKFNENVIEDKNYEMALLSIKLGNLDEASAYLLLFFLKEPNIDKYLADKQDTTEEQKVLLTDNFNLTIERANFLLGEIKLLNGEFADAVSFFAKSYIASKNPEILVKSLYGMILSFATTEKNQELCISTQRFINIKKQLLSDNAGYIIPKEYIDQINDIASKKSCELVN